MAQYQCQQYGDNGEYFGGGVITAHEIVLQSCVASIYMVTNLAVPKIGENIPAEQLSTS
jgi:hypothetical protein